ncbi:hypothetical protein LSAT2_009351, partial [Lamellibrachia satsuma]
LRSFSPQGHLAAHESDAHNKAVFILVQSVAHKLHRLQRPLSTRRRPGLLSSASRRSAVQRGINR